MACISILKSLAVGCFGKSYNLFIIVKQNPPVVGIIVVRLLQRRIFTSKTTIQGCCEASSDTGKPPLLDLADVYGLKKDPALETSI